MNEILIDVEFVELLIPLSDQEYEGLKENIQKEGCRDPIVIWKGIILDGHNRYKICQELNVPFKVIEMEQPSRTDAKIWIVKNQLTRRNLQPIDIDLIKIALTPLIAAKAKENERIRKGRQPGATSPNLEKLIDTDVELDKIPGGHKKNTRRKVKEIKEKAPEKIADIRMGDKTIHKAYSEIKKAEKDKLRKEFPTPNLPDGIFEVILADPPWKYEFSETKSREIENQYATMDLEEIMALKVPSADDAILFLWATAPKLEEALSVLNAWGFSYRTCAIWNKERKGMGYWFRIQHELLLVGIKGEFSPPEPQDRYNSLFSSPRSEHSEKPKIVYEMIERMFPQARRLELFARGEREGWIVWGNEI